MSIIAPATLEGWYVLHQMVALDWTALRGMEAIPRRRLAAAGAALMDALTPQGGRGWSAAFRLAGGGGADLMLVHFRPSLDEIAAVQTQVQPKIRQDKTLGPAVRSVVFVIAAPWW